MGAIQHLLQRLGFVKLGRFGLELTPDGRILSTRPAVLKDESGGRIVGWEDRDLAAAELPRWAPDVEASARRPPARRFPVPAAPPPPPRAAPRPPALPSTIATASPPPSIAPPASAAVMSGVVAAAPAVDEDDWEWTIALARARTEEAPAPAAPRASKAAKPAGKAAARTQQVPSLAAPPPAAASAEWPATEPLGAIDYADYAHMPTRPAMVIPAKLAPIAALTLDAPLAPSNAPAPSTVIPVPSLPSIRSTGLARRLEPVVRTATRETVSPRRFPKGTGPVDPTTTEVMAAIAEDADLAIGDQTRPGIAVPAAATTGRAAPTVQMTAVGDSTRVGIAMPPAARAVALPSIKRRMLPR